MEKPAGMGNGKPPLSDFAHQVQRFIIRCGIEKDRPFARDELLTGIRPVADSTPFSASLNCMVSNRLSVVPSGQSLNSSPTLLPEPSKGLAIMESPAAV